MSSSHQQRYDSTSSNDLLFQVVERMEAINAEEVPRRVEEAS